MIVVVTDEVVVSVGALLVGFSVVLVVEVRFAVSVKVVVVEN